MSRLRYQEDRRQELLLLREVLLVLLRRSRQQEHTKVHQHHQAHQGLFIIMEMERGEGRIFAVS